MDDKFRQWDKDWHKLQFRRAHKTIKHRASRGRELAREVQLVADMWRPWERPVDLVRLAAA